MRSFIAIELTNEIKDELAQIQARLKYSGADVKWVEKNNIHLTLKFLGEVSEDKIKTVVSILDDIAKGSKPFEMTIRDIGAFPKIDYPRVVWVGLDKGASESKEIVQRIEEELERSGFERESKGLQPPPPNKRRPLPQKKEVEGKLGLKGCGQEIKFQASQTALNLLRNNA